MGQDVGPDPGRGAGDRGAASVWVLTVGLVVLLAGLAGAAVGTVILARHRAQSAADLGALAGAVRAAEGRAAACDRAAGIVAANGARLAGCTLDGLDLTVTVEVTVSPMRGLTRTARAQARAGPVRSG